MNVRQICIASVLAALAVNAWSALGAPASADRTRIDVTGTWKAQQQRGPATTTTVFVFRQDKNRVSGTMSANGAPAVEIQKVRIYKTRIKFQVKTTVITRYEATVEGDTMMIAMQSDVGMEGVSGGAGGGMGTGMGLGSRTPTYGGDSNRGGTSGLPAGVTRDSVTDTLGNRVSTVRRVGVTEVKITATRQK